MMRSNEVQPEFDEPLNACPLCASTDIRPFDGDYRGCRIARCRHCGVKFMNPQYSDRHIARFYATYIASHDPESPETTNDIRDIEARGEGKRRALQLLESLGVKGRALMVGCGDGLELRVALEQGWQPEGYDIDAATTSRVAERWRVPVHCGPFTALAEKLQPFDAIFMDQVLEHPKDPGEMLRACRSLLRPGGLLYVATPNIGSLSNRLKTLTSRMHLRRDKRGRHYSTRHHIFYYTPRVLRALLERHYGFEVLVVRNSLKPQRNPIKPLLSRVAVNLDSGMLLVCRRPD